MLQAARVVRVIQVEEPCTGNTLGGILSTRISAHGWQVPRRVNNLDSGKPGGKPPNRDEWRELGHHAAPRSASRSGAFYFP